MANTSMGGFRFKYMRNGSPHPVIELKTVATAIATGIFRGDCLKILTDGTVAPAAAGENISFVSDGAEQYYDGAAVRSGPYLPVSTAWTLRERCSIVRAIVARDAVFEVDANDGTTATTEAAFEALVGTNCDHVVAAGSTATGQSAHALNIGSTTTASAGWRIIGLSTNPANDFTASRAKVLVEINESLEPQFSTTGV